MGCLLLPTTMLIAYWVGTFFLLWFRLDLKLCTVTQWVTVSHTESDTNSSEGNSNEWILFCWIVWLIAMSLIHQFCKQVCKVFQCFVLWSMSNQTALELQDGCFPYFQVELFYTVHKTNSAKQHNALKWTLYPMYRVEFGTNLLIARIKELSRSGKLPILINPIRLFGQTLVLCSTCMSA